MFLVNLPALGKHFFSFFIIFLCEGVPAAYEMPFAHGPKGGSRQAFFGSAGTARAEGAAFRQFRRQGNHAGNGWQATAVVVAQKRRA